MADPFSAASSGGIKSVQAGVYAGVGATITIKAVDTTKAYVISVSKGSAGTVATNSTISGTLSVSNTGGANQGAVGWSAFGTGSFTGTAAGGTTDLYTKQYSARLTSKKTIITDGPCEWQVVEFN